VTSEARRVFDRAESSRIVTTRRRARRTDAYRTCRQFTTVTSDARAATHPPPGAMRGNVRGSIGFCAERSRAVRFGSIRCAKGVLACVPGGGWTVFSAPDRHSARFRDALNEDDPARCGVVWFT
jgi:hypothetical protein